MAIFNSKKGLQRKTETLMNRISTGKCDDLVVSELMLVVSELTDPTRKELILTELKDIALKSGNAASVAASIKVLLAFPPMEMGLEDTLEIRILELITNKIAFSNRALQGTMAEFLYLRISGRVDRAEPFVDALIRFLDERTGTGGTTAYNSLMIVAANRPEYFRQHAGLLIKMLGSINTATRIQTTRIIAVLAMSHSEYVAGAEKTLLHISSFNPDSELKTSASEALQILSSKLRPDEPTPIDDMERRREEPDTSGSLAEIMRRRMSTDKKVPHDSRIDKRMLSMATNFAGKADHAYKTEGDEVGQEESDAEAINKIMDDFSEIAQSIKAEAQPAEYTEIVEAAQPEVQESEGEEESEENELRRMMESVKDDFSINAGSILDALGMGHLARKAILEDVRPRPAEVPVHDRPKRMRLMRSDQVRHEHAPAKPPAKEKVEEEEGVSPNESITSIESYISRTEKEHVELAPAPEAATVTEPVAPMAADGAGNAIAENTITRPPVLPMAADGAGNAIAENTVTVDSPVQETMAPEPAMPVETALPATPTEVSIPDIPLITQPELPRPVKSPMMPLGVRISAMKFKSTDHSKSKKTPTPPKISIRPHIKPLNKTPVDGVKTAQTRQHPMTSTPLAPRSLEPKTEALPGEIICHSCNAKMPEDSQRCAICGSDLKAPKVRCRKCGEINPRGVGKCNRCGTGMDE